MSLEQLARTALIAVDWGTSSLRAAAMGSDGEMLATRASDDGVATLAGAGFAHCLTALLADWQPLLQSAPIYLSGMVGSRQGWIEVPYVPCPARLDDIAAGTRTLVHDGMRLTFVPGLHARSSAADDVMRGEETQLLGAGALESGSLTVMPGTHSKWVHCADGAVRGFATFMTGDLYAAMRGHTVLAHSMRDGGTDATATDASFDAGVRRGFETRALTHTLFSVRTRSLFAPAGGGHDAAAYLSGLLIGHELAGGVGLYPAAREQGLLLVGAPALARAYARAAACVGLRARTGDPHASHLGCLRLARHKGDL